MKELLSLVDEQGQSWELQETQQEKDGNYQGSYWLLRPNDDEQPLMVYQKQKIPNVSNIRQVFCLTLREGNHQPAASHVTTTTATLAQPSLEEWESPPIGTKLLWEDPHVRIWEFRLAPGQACPFHRHTRPYFFLNLTPSLNQELDRHGQPVPNRLPSQQVAGQCTHVKRTDLSAHAVRNVGETLFLQFIVEFQNPAESLTTVQASKRKNNAWGQRFKLSNGLFFLLFLVMLFPPNVNAKWFHQLGPVNLQKLASKNVCGYSWEANVNPDSAKASAKEVSSRPKQWKPSLQKGHWSISETRDLLETYPEWLCRGSVTLGLLKAVPILNGGTRVQTRLFGINILTFGKPVGQRISLKTRGGTEDVVRWKYALQGGIMTASPPAGHLYVGMGTRVSSDRVFLESGLVDYAARVVGIKIPPNPVRVVFYLGTQSFVHGYVMWRYHRYIWNKL